MESITWWQWWWCEFCKNIPPNRKKTLININDYYQCCNNIIFNKYPISFYFFGTYILWKTRIWPNLNECVFDTRVFPILYEDDYRFYSFFALSKFWLQPMGVYLLPCVLFGCLFVFNVIIIFFSRKKKNLTSFVTFIEWVNHQI